MKVAVISDLHLGPGDASDRFGHDDTSFLRFLGFLESNFEKIVLLGDIWETLTPRRGMSARRGLLEAREAHSTIARRFMRPSYLYVHGNHDLVSSVVDGAPAETIIDTDGMRLLFTHGHHHDVLIRRARVLSEAAVWLGGWLLRMKLGWIYRAFDRLDRARSGVLLDPKRCSFQGWAVDLAKQRSADVVVTGHTHLPVRAEHGSRLFLNSGSCSTGNYSFLGIDTKTGNYSVHASW
jgi:predicted phosphodiesterase